MSNKTCAVEGCDRPTHVRGWCVKHYQRWLAHGDPLYTKMPTKDLTVEERLWLCVDRSGGPDACWLWIGKATHKFGYGTLWNGKRPDGAHRIAYIVTYGEPPPDKPVICHDCDNPACCNPKHLFPGTQKDNLLDMGRKGRDRWDAPALGERNGFSKLTEAKVREIRRRRAEGEPRKSVAQAFGIAEATVKNVTSRRSWKHVD